MVQKYLNERIQAPSHHRFRTKEMQKPTDFLDGTQNRYEALSVKVRRSSKIQGFLNVTLETLEL